MSQRTKEMLSQMSLKEKIYHLMGDKLIYETDEVVEFKLTKDRQRKELHDFYDRIACSFGLGDLVRFIANQSLEAVYSNRTSTGYEYGDVKIPKDMAGLMLSGILSDTLILTSSLTLTPVAYNIRIINKFLCPKGFLISGTKNILSTSS